MRRRDFLKSFLAVPFVGILKKRVPTFSGDHSQPSSSSSSTEPLTLEKLRKCKDGLDKMERLRIEAAEKAANPPMYGSPPMLYNPSSEYFAAFDKEWQKRKNAIILKSFT